MGRRRSYNHMERETRSLVMLICAIGVAMCGAVVWAVNAFADLVAKIFVSQERKKKAMNVAKTDDAQKQLALGAVTALPRPAEPIMTQAGDDELFFDAVEVAVEAGIVSTALLQRKLNVGYAGAARLIDKMEQNGIVGPFEGSRPRQVLLTKEKYYELKLSGRLPNFEGGRACEFTDDKEIAENETAASTEPFHDLKSTLSLIDNMDGAEFEVFIAKLLETLGYENISLTKASGDQGVDVLATRDGLKYAIQCKNYTSPLGNDPVQEVFTGKEFYNCHVGVVATNSTFTSGAVALAEKTGTLLWDRAMISQMIEKAISVKQKDTASILPA